MMKLSIQYLSITLCVIMFFCSMCDKTRKSAAEATVEGIEDASLHTEYTESLAKQNTYIHIQMLQADLDILGVRLQYFQCEDEFDRFSKPGVEQSINQRVHTGVQQHDPRQHCKV